MSELFKIINKNDGTTMYDYTSNITVPDYQINKKPEYVEYTDCNYVVHRDIARAAKISGTFTLYFDDVADIQAFFTNVENHTLTDGSVHCKIYVMNLMQLKDAYLYLEYTPSNTLPYMGTKSHDGFQVTVTER